MEQHLLKILVVDDEPEFREVIKLILNSHGYRVDEATSGKHALQMLEETPYNLVLTDLMMPEMSGQELLRTIKENYPDIEVILITGYGSVQSSVEAMKEGAYSYFIKSHDPEELVLEIKKIEKLSKLLMTNQALLDSEPDNKLLLKSSNKEFQRILGVMSKAAVSNTNILLLGESGVGKEVFARQIHKLSTRNTNPFIAVNCHGFSESLLESELFGHEKGAFTGALDKRIGRIEASHGGSLFLDEIGDTSLSTQAKLLRTLESRSIERLGSNKVYDVDFRLICATNRDVYSMIKSSEFREDFFFRISTITLEIPPLRNRREDIPDLLNFFISQSSSNTKKRIVDVDDKVMTFLLEYDYPGNVREMKNIVERLVVLSENGIIRFQDMPEFRIEKSFEPQITDLKTFRSNAEKEYIEFILKKCDNNMTRAAKVLDISRRQLINKVNEYGIEKI